MQDDTRNAAFDLVAAVLDRGRSLETALDALGPMEPRDRAAGHRLAAAVLRRLGTLDAVLEPYLKKAPPPAVHHILRIGAAGLLLLGTPAHAGVATAVAMARTRGLVPFAGLVNAVLRRVAEGGQAALEALDSPRLDTPSWLWRSWGGDARAIALAHQLEAPLDLTIKQGAAIPDGAVLLPTGSYRMDAHAPVAAMEGFATGDWWVQDAAAALPARVLAAQPGERVIDLCAAPGGKTAQLAAAGADVTAVEMDGSRMARLRENLARLGLAATCVTSDARLWRPETLADAVLLDAPCSATGTIRRHPDALRLKRPKDVTALAGLQDELLEAATAMLRPGGRLIYAVCSLQPEEGPQRFAAALARLPLRAAPIDAAALGLPEAAQPDGTLRTTPALWPERGGMDGFFIASAVRT
jgi:16S rRNA (cytosine967-C5)-methyltransferase